MSLAQLDIAESILDQRFRSGEMSAGAYMSATEDLKLCRIRAMRAARRTS
jgi:hypothetical protein